MALTAKTCESVDQALLAKRIAKALSQFDDILAVCLVGSVARGDAHEESDIDLVVLGEGRLRRSELLRRLPRKLRSKRVSLLCFSRDRWMTEAKSGSLFLHHVRLEGIALLDRDSVLAEGLALAAERPPDVDRELRRQVSRLRLYRHPERLNGEHLFALSHMYAIGKAVAIARCVELGEPTFVKAEALAVLAARRPALAHDVAIIDRLQPFYNLTREQQPDALPFKPVNAASEVERARTAIERLAYG